MGLPPGPVAWLRRPPSLPASQHVPPATQPLTPCPPDSSRHDQLCALISCFIWREKSEVGAGCSSALYSRAAAGCSAVRLRCSSWQPQAPQRLHCCPLFSPTRPAVHHPATAGGQQGAARPDGALRRPARRRAPRGQGGGLLGAGFVALLYCTVCACMHGGRVQQGLLAQPAAATGCPLASLHPTLAPATPGLPPSSLRQVAADCQVELDADEYVESFRPGGYCRYRPASRPAGAAQLAVAAATVGLPADARSGSLPPARPHCISLRLLQQKKTRRPDGPGVGLVQRRPLR